MRDANRVTRPAMRAKPFRCKPGMPTALRIRWPGYQKLIAEERAAAEDEDDYNDCLDDDARPEPHDFADIYEIRHWWHLRHPRT